MLYLCLSSTRTDFGDFYFLLYIPFREIIYFKAKIELFSTPIRIIFCCSTELLRRSNLRLMLPLFQLDFANVGLYAVDFVGYGP